MSRQSDELSLPSSFTIAWMTLFCPVRLHCRIWLSGIRDPNAVAGLLDANSASGEADEYMAWIRRRAIALPLIMTCATAAAMAACGFVPTVSSVLVIGLISVFVALSGPVYGAEYGQLTILSHNLVLLPCLTIGGCVAQTSTWYLMSAMYFPLQFQVTSTARYGVPLFSEDCTFGTGHAGVIRQAKRYIAYSCASAVVVAVAIAFIGCVDAYLKQRSVLTWQWMSDIGLSVLTYSFVVAATSVRMWTYPIEVLAQTIINWTDMIVRRSTLAWSPVNFHEYSFFPLPGLRAHIERSGDERQDLLLQVIHRCLRTPGQRSVGNRYGIPRTRSLASVLVRHALARNFAAVLTVDDTILTGMSENSAVLQEFQRIAKLVVLSERNHDVEVAEEYRRTADIALREFSDELSNEACEDLHPIQSAVLLWLGIVRSLGCEDHWIERSG